ncbi:unnamed protein product [Urochloa humidicola]
MTQPPAKHRRRAAVIPSEPILMQPASSSATTSSWGLRKRRSSAANGSNACGVSDRSGSGMRSPRCKGKNETMVPKQQSPRCIRNGGGSSRLPPPAKKLVHDAISSERNNNNMIKEEAAACHHGLNFGDNQVSDALLARLSELGASASWFVDAKRLQSTDARVNQNRLQLSGWGPISQAFTDAEKARLRAPAGMPVAALDRRGREYEMTCRLWKNDKHYRFMGCGWKDFREDHRLTIPKDAHLTRRVTVELWAFRSRALLPPGKGEGDDEAENEIRHPDGTVGMVMLLREDDDGGEQQNGTVVAEEVAPPAESYASWFLLLMAAAALLTLRTRETKRKRDDGD